MNPAATAVVYGCDPGVEYYALARFELGKLRSVCLPDIATRTNPEQNVTLVIEVPQIYDARAGGTGARARKKDVADTLFAAGRIADRYANVVKVTPSQWKSQLTKTQDHERTRAALTADENAVIDAVKLKSERGHILDAVGIGLKYLWRR
jgi:hypothetical protein